MNNRKTSLFVALFLASCSHPGVAVSRDEMGDRWPLTVDRGVVERLPGNAAVIHVAGKTYALNGTAATKGYPRIDPIWRDNPRVPGTKVSIGPLIKLAMDQAP